MMADRICRRFTSWLAALSPLMCVVCCSQANYIEDGLVPPPIVISPSMLTINRAFSVDFNGVARAGISDIKPPDGTYNIQLEKVDVESSPIVDPATGLSISFRPLDPQVRIDIGTAVVKNGVGVAKFVLQSKYGDSQMEVGKGIFIYVRNDKWGAGVGAKIIG